MSKANTPGEPAGDLEPRTSPAPSPSRTSAPLTEERKATFLRVLAETGSTAAAASAATPWSEHRQGGLSTFRDEMRRNPTFAAAVEGAQQQALATLEKEAYRRAKDGTLRPVYQKGMHVGDERVFDNSLLLRVLARLDPTWSPKQQIEHSGRIDHAVLAITPADIFLLPETKQDLLLGLLDELADLKGDDDELQNLPAPSGD